MHLPTLQIYSYFKLYWLTHLRWISAMNYSWAGCMRVEFENRWFACGPNAGIDALGIYPEVTTPSCMMSVFL